MLFAFAFVILVGFALSAAFWVANEYGRRASYLYLSSVLNFGMGLLLLVVLPQLSGGHGSHGSSPSSVLAASGGSVHSVTSSGHPVDGINALSRDFSQIQAHVSTGGSMPLHSVFTTILGVILIGVGLFFLVKMMKEVRRVDTERKPQVFS